MRTSLFRWTLLVGSFAVLLNVSLAQSVPAASRSIGLSVFGGYVYDTPDYGQYNDTGFLAGVDVARSIHHFEVAIDARYTFATGQGVAEKSFMGGPKIEFKLGHAHPYADVLLGYGLFDFTHPTSSYVSDNSVVYAYGGGIDYEIWRGFGVKGDAQIQHWQLGNANSALQPFVLAAGVTYRVPVHSSRGPR